MFNSNIYGLTRLLCKIYPVGLQNLGDLEFDLSRSLKVNSNGAVGLPIYDFLLLSNSNYMYVYNSITPFRTYSQSKNFSYLLSLATAKF